MDVAPIGRASVPHTAPYVVCITYHSRWQKDSAPSTRGFRLGPAGLSRAVVIQLSPSGERFGSEYLGVHSCTPRCEPSAPQV